MRKEDETRILAAIEGKDVTEVLALVMRGGNRYSRRILKFFKWFCKWMPHAIMAWHFMGVCDFARTPRELFVPNEGNALCWAFMYFMLYVLPMAIMLASRFFWLCWKYRIPFFYYFGVNAIHLYYASVATTNDMVEAHFCLMAMIVMFYVYGGADWFLTETSVGRKLFS